MDERVAKFVLATGFENFEKGEKSYGMRYFSIFHFSSKPLTIFMMFTENPS
jgi:hypothetical protein